MSDDARQHSKVEIEAVIIRCNCGDPSSHLGRVCPTPGQVEDYGIVSYDHPRAINRAVWRLSRFYRDKVRRRPFEIIG